MSVPIRQAEEIALQLNPEDKLHLIETLMESLDRPDPALDEAWKKEAESRIHAYEKGDIDAVSWDEVKEQKN